MLAELLKDKVARKEAIQDAILIVFGVVFASLGLEGFLLPNKFLDGGVTGVSLLVTHYYGENLLPYLIAILNIPFIFLAHNMIGKRFAFKTMAATILLAFVLYFVEWPEITKVPLLIAIFGGFFIGMGTGLCIRGGCVIDGTEVLALFVNRRSSLTIGDIILVMNVLIFGIAAFIFTIDIALYSIITYLAAAKTVDFVVQGVEEYNGVTIISTKPDEIRKAIIHRLGRGVTIYKGERGFSTSGLVSQDLKIVFTVVTRLELTRLKNEINHIDENAFVFTHPISETKGGLIKKRRLQE